jgi:hypothetical protein
MSVVACPKWIDKLANDTQKYVLIAANGCKVIPQPIDVKLDFTDSLIRATASFYSKEWLRIDRC